MQTKKPINEFCGLLVRCKGWLGVPLLHVLSDPTRSFISFYQLVIH